MGGFLYAALMLLSIGAAHVLERWSVEQLYAFSYNNSLVLSLTQMKEDSVVQIMNTILADSSVVSILQQDPIGDYPTYLNYIVPAGCSASEIPGGVSGDPGGHPFGRLEKRSDTLNVIFTKAIVQEERMPIGKSLLLRTRGRIPIILVWFDAYRQRVLRVETLSQHPDFLRVPVPLF